MAFHFPTFRTRALSAIVFAVIMLGGLYWNELSFLLLFSLIHMGCWIEYQRLICLIDPNYSKISPFHKYGIILSGWGFMLWMTGGHFKISTLLLSEIGWWLFLALSIGILLYELLYTGGKQFKMWMHSLFGLLYISLSWALLVDMRLHPPAAFSSIDSWLLPVLLIVSIWINDTMAYIVGSFIGRTPFSAISPKKTWEGTIGGAVLAIGIIGWIGFQFFPAIQFHIIAIAGIGAVIGTVGDLLESKLKRLAGIKDSGRILPGHGGFLDRFDSLLLAVPFTWAYLYFFA